MDTATARVSFDVPHDHPAFAGHFPGRPMWPGVLLLAEVMEALRCTPLLAARLGPTPCIAVAKFLAPVEPGARLSIELREDSGGVAFAVRRVDAIVASGRLVREMAPADPLTPALSPAGGEGASPAPLPAGGDGASPAPSPARGRGLG